MDFKEIEIQNCHDCPFANWDNERGYDWCNLADQLDLSIQLDSKNWETLPSHKRHDKCPLNQFGIKITVI